MIYLPAGSRIWLVAVLPTCETVESKVQNILKDDPFSGHLFIFRGHWSDLIKVLWADSDGLYLFTKLSERGRFVWLVTRDGKVHLNSLRPSCPCCWKASTGSNRNEWNVPGSAYNPF